MAITTDIRGWRQQCGPRPCRVLCQVRRGHWPCEKGTGDARGVRPAAYGSCRSPRDRGKSTTCETLGVPALCTGCALVNGAAHASPPYGLRSPTRAAGRAAHPRLPSSKCSRYVLSCPARTSSLPTPTSSFASDVGAARGRAPIASPGSPRSTARKSRCWSSSPISPETALSGARAIPERRAAAPTSSTSSFLLSLRIGRRKARGASASSKGAASSAQTRRRAPQPPPEQRYLYTAAHAPSLVDLERVFAR
jgi:hypothetical protein